jgi:hypothetical protein
MGHWLFPLVKRRLLVRPNYVLATDVDRQLLANSYLAIDFRPTKRGKKKSPSDGHSQCEKAMDDH